VAAVHRVAVSEAVEHEACCDEEACCDDDSDNAKCGSCCGCVGAIKSRIEVPEVAHAALGGEWLIPGEGALVLSLGVRTTGDAAGKAIVSERLVLIEASGPGDSCVEQASLGRPLTEVHPAIACPMAPPAGIPMPMQMPAMPSRSLPQALSADGSPLPLPPLPEDATTPSSLPGSAEPCASPQKSHKKPGDSTLDFSSTKAGYVPAPNLKRFQDAPSDHSDPMTVRFPINAGGMNVVVEVRTGAPRVVLDKFQTGEPTQVRK
jgi:hypothetical protein